MIRDMLRKAASAVYHPGVSSRVGWASMFRRALPYFFSFRGYGAYPVTVYLSINSICNLKCKMCDVGMQAEDANFYKNLRLDGSRDQIKFEEFSAIVDQISHFRPMLAITSTEPLLHKEISRCVEYARGQGLEVLLTTGGYLLPRLAEDLVKARLSRLFVSLDGPAAIHNEIRGVKDSFERAVEGIRKVTEFKKKYQVAGPEIFINYTVTNHNQHCLLEFLESVKDLDLARVNISLMSFVTQEMADIHNQRFGQEYHATINCVGGGTDPLLVDTDQLWRQFDEAKRRFGSKIEILPHFKKSELDTYFNHPTTAVNKTRCMVSYFIAQIIANGDVIPYTRCYNVALGNIRRQSFDEIWNGKKMRKFRRDLRRYGQLPACVRCDQVA